MSTKFHFCNTNSGNNPFTGSINNEQRATFLSQHWNYYTGATGKASFYNVPNFYLSKSASNYDSSFIESTQSFRKTVSGTENEKILNRVFVSPPLNSGTNLQNLYSGQIRAGVKTSGYLSGSFLNYGYVSLYIQNVGYVGPIATFIGNQFYWNPPNNKMIEQNYIDSGYNINSSGVRLVVEVGAQLLSSQTGLYSFSQYFGYRNTGDLPVDNSSTSILNPWIEFSDTI